MAVFAPITAHPHSHEEEIRRWATEDYERCTLSPLYHGEKLSTCGISFLVRDWNRFRKILCCEWKRCMYYYIDVIKELESTPAPPAA